MHIVVIGLGEVGRHLLSVLDREGHDIVAVDRSEAALQHVEDHFDVAILKGYGASHEILTKAAVGRADLVAAITDHDEVNLIAALAAKQLGARRVIARVQRSDWTHWREGVRYGLLGVDVVINPRVLVAQELARVARSHGASDVVDLAQGRVELVQVELRRESRLLGKPLSKVAIPRLALVAAIVRDGELFVPGGAEVMRKGDRVYLVGRPDAILETEDMLTGQREAGRVCIIGGGVIGRSMAESLVEQGSEVLLFEQDRDRAVEVAGALPGVTVVHGDGTDAALLEEEQVGSYDLLAAVTNHDEINLMAALLAQRLEVGRSAAVVQRANYLPIYRQLGVDVVLSPRTVASDHILRYSRSEELQSLTAIEGGAAELVEMRASARSTVIGVPLRKLMLPRGTLLAAIVHDDEVIIPRGDDAISAGDSVIVITSHETLPQLERLFRPRAA